MPREWFGKEWIQLRAGTFQVAHKEPDDQAWHGEVLAPLEQDCDEAIRGDVHGEQLIAEPLQRLQRTHARIGTDPRPAVPAPDVVVAHVRPRLPGDPHLSTGRIDLLVG